MPLWAASPRPAPGSAATSPQAAGRKGEYIEPSKQKLGPYGAEVIAGLRILPQTRASYR
jgi:hypothetical protein